SGTTLTANAAQPAVEPVRGRRTASVVIVVLLLAGIATATVYWLEAGDGRERTSDAYVDGRTIRVSPKVSGQVLKLNVGDNALVHKGDLLFEIDPADFQAKVEQATAAVQVAESGVEQSKAAVAQAEAAMGEAEAARRISDT